MFPWYNHWSWLVNSVSMVDSLFFNVLSRINPTVFHGQNHSFWWLNQSKSPCFMLGSLSFMVHLPFFLVKSSWNSALQLSGSGRDHSSPSGRVSSRAQGTLRGHLRRGWGDRFWHGRHTCGLPKRPDAVDFQVSWSKKILDLVKIMVFVCFCMFLSNWTMIFI